MAEIMKRKEGTGKEKGKSLMTSLPWFQSLQFFTQGLALGGSCTILRGRILQRGTECETLMKPQLARPLAFQKENRSSHHATLALHKNSQLRHCWQGSSDPLYLGHENSVALLPKNNKGITWSKSADCASRIKANNWIRISHWNWGGGGETTIKNSIYKC